MRSSRTRGARKRHLARMKFTRLDELVDREIDCLPSDIKPKSRRDAAWRDWRETDRSSEEER